MANTEFEIKDYGSFANAQGQVKNYQNSIEVVQSKTKSAKSVVGDGSVFMGPAAETCAINLDILNLTLNGAIYRYNKISSYLGGTEMTYKKGDNISKQVVATRIGELVDMDLSKLPIIAGNEVGISMALQKNTTVPNALMPNLRSTPSTLEIPENLAQRGYTVTGYGDKGIVYTDLSSKHWASGTNQSKIFDEWEKQGKRYKNGIAVVNVNGKDCYLVATSSEAGKVGDHINVKLKNGESFPALVADQKSSGDSNYTKYGHTGKGGTNVIEFEVDMHKFKELGSNPNTKDWGLEWDSSSGVKSIDNYGSVLS